MPLRAINMVLWSLLAVLVLATTVFPVNDFDTWYHLKTGEYILTHRAIPTRDVFSFTAQGRTWITHEWLFEVLMFLAWKIGSLNAVIVLKSVMVALGFLFLWLTLRRLKVETAIGAPLAILAVYMVTFRAFARPHVATEAFLALYLYVLLMFKYRPDFRARCRLLGLLLPVQLVWANVHSGMVLGVGLFALFVASEYVQGHLARRTPSPASLPSSLNPSIPASDLRFLSFLTLGLFAVSFINPNMHRALLYPFIITREPIFSGGIRELQSPLLRMFWTTDFFICLLLLLAIGVISFVLNRRRLELFSLAVFALTALAALLALRNVPIFALLAVPLVAINIQQACNHKLQTTNLKLRSAIGCLLSAVLLVLNVLVFFRGAHVANDYRRPGFGYDRRIFPNGAADFVLRNKVPGHIFSTMEYGGYFIWMWYPEHQVYIDGRLDVYGSDLFETYGKVFWSAPILDSVVERYDLNCFVLPQPPSNTAPTRSYIGRTLALRSDWSLVYFDDLALVYLRDVPRNRKLIDRFAYRALVPSLLGLPEEGPDPEQNLQEARRAVAANPESPLAQTMLGVTLSQAGEFDSAGRAFDHALKLDPRYGDALLGLGILYARRQRPDTAIAVLERLVRLEPSNGFARLNLALVCMQDETWGYAQQQLLKAIELNPELVAAYGLLGDIYFRHEMYDMAGRIWRDALRVSPEDPTILRRLEQLEGR